MVALVKCAFILSAVIAASAFNLGSQDVVFHLFTRNNPQLSQPLLPVLGSIVTSAFSLQLPTIITVHTHDETVAGNMNAFVIPAHLNYGNVNLIAVDWSAGGPMYSMALANAPQVGQVIATFCNILIDSFGYPADQIKIVGHGLGGHIAGIAARNINGDVPHIVALDPSFVGWTHHPDILNADDAGVVEVLHATAGIIGYDRPLGDLDFYPNGGTHQNGCGTNVDCSHIYAYAFYAESITAEAAGGNQFVGTACESLEQAVALQCAGERDAIFGGSGDKTGQSGIYSFITNFSQPFARG